MKKILIDIDDVICENVYFDVMKKVTGSDIDLDDCKHYKIEDNFNVTAEQKAEFFKRICNDNIYKTAKLKTNCKEVIEKLNKRYEIYICSAVVVSGNKDDSGNLFTEKFNFLCKNFPFLNPNNFIFCSDKTMFRADIMIDDKTENLEGNNKRMKLLFTAFHNKNINEKELKEQGLIRVTDWKEVEKILL